MTDYTTQIADLELAIQNRVAGRDAVRVKEGDRETEFARVTLAEMQQRLDQLKALQAGTSRRVAARRVFF